MKNNKEQELNGWDENVKAFVKEKQMTKEVQEEFLTEYDSHLFRGGIDDVEWFYNELYGGNKMKYIVVYGNGISDLTVNVNKCLDEGWKLQGGFYLGNDGYCYQAMVSEK